MDLFLVHIVEIANNILSKLSNQKDCSGLFITYTFPYRYYYICRTFALSNTQLANDHVIKILAHPEAKVKVVQATAALAFSDLNASLRNLNDLSRF